MSSSTQQAVVSFAALIMLAASGAALAADASSQKRVAAFAKLPDWSGAWERFNVGPSGGPADPAEFQRFIAAFAALHPPYNAEWEAKYQAEVKRLGKAPPLACGAGVPAPSFLTLMVAPQLIMLPLLTPEGIAFQFYGGNMRFVPTDGSTHPPLDERWVTPMGDAIAHWEREALVIDTVSAQAAIAGGAVPAPLSEQAHFVERMRRVDANTIDYQITVDDPTALRQPWVLKFQYHRVQELNQIPYSACTGNERNPVVDGKFIIAPPR
jgi:hypothetical protein